MVWAEDRLPKKLCLTRGWGGVEGVRGALWAGRTWWTNYDGWVVNFEDGEAFPPTDHRAGYRLDPPFNAHRLLGRQDGSFLQHQFPLQHPRPVAGSLLNLCRHPHLPPRPPAPHLHSQATHAVSAEGELLESSPSGHVPSTEEPASTL